MIDGLAHTLISTVRAAPATRDEIAIFVKIAATGGGSQGANLFQRRRVPEVLIAKGVITRAETLADLAREIGVRGDELTRTMLRFNEFTVMGLDPDFGRGQSAFNDCVGNPGHRPNAAIGPLDRPPYFATKIIPGDVGTCGGVITNEHAHVIDDNDQVIDGLYATGNITATVMGRTYLGAGGSIANIMVFVYVAARHAAGYEIPN
ncbi:FAD-binding protein [Mycobacterium hodleri]|uniref:FAD-binding protein n=1 Tax=Mycolicibacterium hodleri TaxID=49897 RepID=A0A502E5E5_9MYCO|nr:FAD-binding protein [Mycolicibacterium hodleri]